MLTHRRAIFYFSSGSVPAALASWLFDPPGPPKRNNVSRFLNISCACNFFLLTLSFSPKLFSSTLLFYSSLLCFHLSMLSEVWLWNFLSLFFDIRRRVHPGPSNVSTAAEISCLRTGRSATSCTCFRGWKECANLRFTMAKSWRSLVWIQVHGTATVGCCLKDRKSRPMARRFKQEPFKKCGIEEWPTEKHRLRSLELAAKKKGDHDAIRWGLYALAVLECHNE